MEAETANELSRLSLRELKDLGINRGGHPGRRRPCALSAVRA
jgi:uncharacterized protein YjiS (DUF1127 family)